MLLGVLFGIGSGSLVLNSLDSDLEFFYNEKNNYFSSSSYLYFSNPYLNYIFQDVDNCGQNLKKGMINMVYCFKPILKEKRRYLI